MHQVYDLDFKSSTAWRLPLERTLVKHAMKLVHHKITLENETWKIDGCPVDAECQKRLSKIVWACVVILHMFKNLMFKSYRKKFHRAVTTLECLQSKAKAAVQAEKVKSIKNAETKKKALLSSQEHLGKALQEAEAEKAKLEKFKTDFQEKEASKKKSIEKHSSLKQMLEICCQKKAELERGWGLGLFSDRKEKLEAEINELQAKLNKEPDFISIRFERMNSSEMHAMVERQEEKIKNSSEQLEAITRKYEQKLSKKQEKAEKTDKDLSEFTIALEKAQEEFFKIAPEIRRSLRDFERQNVRFAPQIAANNGIGKVEEIKHNPELDFIDFLNLHNSDFANLFSALFNNFKNKLQKEIVRDFKDLGNGSGEIYFTGLHRMWLSSKDKNGKEDPKGGIILRLGDNPSRSIKFSINANNIQFEDGFNMTVKVNFWIGLLVGMKDFISPKIAYLKSGRSNHLILAATAMKHTREREKTLDELITNWGEKGVVVMPNQTDEFVIKQHL